MRRPLRFLSITAVITILIGAMIGTPVSAYDRCEHSPEPPGVKHGKQIPVDIDEDNEWEDVDGDGFVNILDVGVLLVNIQRNDTDETWARWWFDFNNDTYVTIVDVGALLNEVVHDKDPQSPPICS